MNFRITKKGNMTSDNSGFVKELLAHYGYSVTEVPKISPQVEKFKNLDDNLNFVYKIENPDFLGEFSSHTLCSLYLYNKYLLNVYYNENYTEHDEKLGNWPDKKFSEMKMMDQLIKKELSKKGIVLKQV